MDDGHDVGSTKLKGTIRDLLAEQNLGVLSTSAEGQPYGNLMAFAETPDLQNLLFCTPRKTRKYANVSSDSRASMLIDNRSNEERDFHAAIAVTAVGKVEEVRDDAPGEMRELYLSKHPYMEDFLRAPTTALMRLAVDSYCIVLRFQNVYVVKMR